MTVAKTSIKVKVDKPNTAESRAAACKGRTRPIRYSKEELLVIRDKVQRPAHLSLPTWQPLKSHRSRLAVAAEAAGADDGTPPLTPITSEGAVFDTIYSMLHKKTAEEEEEEEDETTPVAATPVKAGLSEQMVPTPGTGRSDKPPPPLEPLEEDDDDEGGAGHGEAAKGAFTTPPMPSHAIPDPPALLPAVPQSLHTPSRSTHHSPASSLGYNHPSATPPPPSSASRLSQTPFRQTSPINLNKPLSMLGSPSPSMSPGGAAAAHASSFDRQAALAHLHQLQVQQAQLLQGQADLRKNMLQLQHAVAASPMLYQRMSTLSPGYM